IIEPRTMGAREERPVRQRESTMRIDIVVDEGVTVLHITGEVDIATAEQLQTAGEQALTSYAGTLRIDLSGVTFLDSAGIGALIAIRNKAGQTQHTLILDHPSERITRLLALTGLSDVFHLKPAGNTAV